MNDPGLLIKGHQLVGTTLLSIGDYPTASSHLESAVMLSAGEERRTLAISFAADVVVAALSNWAWALWHRGYPDQATDAAESALDTLGNPGMFRRLLMRSSIYASKRPWREGRAMQSGAPVRR